MFMVRGELNDVCDGGIVPIEVPQCRCRRSNHNFARRDGLARLDSFRAWCRKCGPDKTGPDQHGSFESLLIRPRTTSSGKMQGCLPRFVR